MACNTNSLTREFKIHFPWTLYSIYIKKGNTILKSWYKEPAFTPKFVLINEKHFSWEVSALQLPSGKTQVSYYFSVNMEVSETTFFNY